MMTVDDNTVTMLKWCVYTHMTHRPLSNAKWNLSNSIWFIHRRMQILWAHSLYCFCFAKCFFISLSSNVSNLISISMQIYCAIGYPCWYLVAHLLRMNKVATDFFFACIKVQILTQTGTLKSDSHVRYCHYRSNKLRERDI